jgi:hypothetical protein
MQPQSWLCLLMWPADLLALIDAPISKAKRRARLPWGVGKG